MFQEIRKGAYSENLNLDIRREGANSVTVASVQKGLHGGIDCESTVDYALSRKLHDNQAAGFLTSNVDVDFGGASRNLSDVDGDLRKVASLDKIEGTSVSLRGALGAVQLVDDGADAGFDLSLGLLPVLDALVGVAHALDALDGVGSVELSVCLEEWLQGGVGSDGGSCWAVESRLALVGCGEDGRVRHDGLPERPHAVNVGVVHEAVPILVILNLFIQGHVKPTTKDQSQSNREQGTGCHKHHPSEWHCESARR